MLQISDKQGHQSIVNTKVLDGYFVSLNLKALLFQQYLQASRVLLWYILCVAKKEDFF